MALPGSPGWQQQILQGVGAPVTPSNLQFLNAWQQAEGGTASNNPFNTTQTMPGSSAYNTVAGTAGVQNFTSPQQGIQATIQTLQNGHYGNILTALKNGSSAMAAAQAVANSPWGTGQGVMRVLGGGNVPSTAPGAATPNVPTPPPMPGSSPLLPIQSVVPGSSGVPSSSSGDLTSQGLLSAMMPGGQGVMGYLLGQGMQSLNQPIGSFNATPIQQAQAKGVQTATTPTGTTVQVQGKVGAKDMAAVKLAEHFIGTPYQWGGSTPQSGFDCSGLLQYVWGQQGVEIPRTTYDQFQSGTPVAKKNLQPGDAVYFTGSDPKNGLPGHVGMYIGGGKFVEAPHTGADVRVSTLAGRSDYVGARTFV